MTPATTDDDLQTQPRAGNVSAKLLAVEDGDTASFEIDGARTPVRLMGINAPDRGECRYDEATEGLTGLLEGGAISVEVRGIDQFERVLAYVWVDGEVVNLTLVEDGLAIATTPEADDQHGDDLLAAEEAAYEAGVGLWDGCDAAESAGLELVIDTDSHDPPGPDQEVLSEEVVTITNLGGADVDLLGWILRDESSAHRFPFPPGAGVPAGGVLVIASSDMAWDPGESPVWSNAGDMALLLDAKGGVVSRARYQE